jgi:hypothetical protein
MAFRVHQHYRLYHNDILFPPKPPSPPPLWLVSPEKEVMMGTMLLPVSTFGLKSSLIIYVTQKKIKLDSI